MFRFTLKFDPYNVSKSHHHLNKIQRNSKILLFDLLYLNEYKSFQVVSFVVYTIWYFISPVYSIKISKKIKRYVNHNLRN